MGWMRWAGCQWGVVGEVDAAAWTQARSALEKREVSVAELLRERRLSLRADLLGPWALWIPPKFESRRFDTRFFVALIPPGQSVGRLSSEAATGSRGAGLREVLRQRGGRAERSYRDVRLFRIYEGISQIHQLVIARDVLKDFMGIAR